MMFTLVVVFIFGLYLVKYGFMLMSAALKKAAEIDQNRGNETFKTGKF